MSVSDLAAVKLFVWTAGRPLVRVHSSAYGATEPHPGPEAEAGLLWPRTRFAHFRPAPRRRWVATLYGGQDDAAGLSETVFHTVPAVGGRERRPSKVLARRYLAHMLSSIAATRDLSLIDLTPDGLDAAGLAEADVIMSPSSTYPDTAALARRLYVDAVPADGLVWRSRQQPDRLAVALWFATTRRAAAYRGAGLVRADLRVVDPPQPLLAEEGMRRLLRVGNALDITVVPPEAHKR